METFHIPTEGDIKKWMKEALNEYFNENHRHEPVKDDKPAESFLNRKQAAAVLKISLVTLHDRMNRGLPYHKDRGSVYFIHEEIVSYVTSRRGSNSHPSLTLHKGHSKYQRRVA